MASTYWSKAIMPLIDRKHFEEVRGFYKVPIKRRLAERYAQGVRMTMKEFRR